MVENIVRETTNEQQNRPSVQTPTRQTGRNQPRQTESTINRRPATPAQQPTDRVYRIGDIGPAGVLSFLIKVAIQMDGGFLKWHLRDMNLLLFGDYTDMESQELDPK